MEYEAAYLDYSSNDNKLPIIEEEDAYMNGNKAIPREGLLVTTVQSEGITMSYSEDMNSSSYIAISRGLSKVRSYFGEIKEKIKTPILSLQRLMA